MAVYNTYIGDLKEQIAREQNWLCACGCGQRGHDLHHIIPRDKRYPELDCKENLILVNHAEHIAGKFDTREWRQRFWDAKKARYGADHMRAWLAALPMKVKPRF